MKKSKILALLDEHTKNRTQGINLVVSENRLSADARKALASDLAGRYHTPWYAGTSVAREIVETVESLARELFRARYALVLPLSGNVCDLAALFAFTKPGDSVAMLPFQTGGYPFGLEKFDRKRVDLPVHAGTLEIDTGAAAERIAAEQPRLTILGGSSIPFPHPVNEIHRAVSETVPEGVCVFDGSHVLGLIACKAFQDPLQEGADVLIGSTHKTLPGPQGGLVVTNREDCYEALKGMLDFDLDSGLGLVDNPHVNRIAALGVVLEEMLADQGYGHRVIENARTLAAALDGEGVPVRFKEKGYTASHQVLLDLEFERSQALCQNLEQVGIYIDIGGRVGLAEVTNIGWKPPSMKELANLISTVYHTGPCDETRHRVQDLIQAR